MLDSGFAVEIEGNIKKISISGEKLKGNTKICHLPAHISCSGRPLMLQFTTSSPFTLWNPASTIDSGKNNFDNQWKKKGRRKKEIKELRKKSRWKKRGGKEIGKQLGRKEGRRKEKRNEEKRRKGNMVAECRRSGLTSRGQGHKG